VHVARTSRLLGLGFGPGKAGQQNRDQQGNDGNYHQKLNQGKPGTTTFHEELLGKKGVAQVWGDRFLKRDSSMTTIRI
jgi:hypothetical protein